MTTVFDKSTTQIKWKGKTFQQLASSVKLNKSNHDTNNGISQIFRARPMKIYRKEIASQEPNCNSRTSLKIDDFNAPGSIITNTSSNMGLANTLDIHSENNNCQHPNETNQHCIANIAAEQNALRRVRSSGMTQSKYKIHSRDNYFSSTNQYLNNRNISFKSNEYFNIRKGDPTATPGTLQAQENVYTSNGITTCPKFLISEEITYSYFWIDASANANTVTVPAGSYDIAKLNQILHTTMVNNVHYFIKKPQNLRIYLLNFLYNSNNGKVTIQLETVNSSTEYSLPYSTDPIVWASDLDGTYKHVCLDLVSSPVFAEAIGFEPTLYPNPKSNTSGPLSFTGTKPSKIVQNFLPITYKPNNSQFATQGAVSSGDLIARKKYNTITTVGSSYRSAFGAQTANSLAYGVPSYGYTVKDKIGFPIKCSPRFPKYSDKMIKCNVRTFTHII